jgi:biopolymer transport protein ExbB/TolQ
MVLLVTSTLHEAVFAVSNGQVTSILDLMMKGGIIMIPILLLSVISVYIFIERYVYIRKLSAVDGNLVPLVVGELKEKTVKRRFLWRQMTRVPWAGYWKAELKIQEKQPERLKGVWKPQQTLWSQKWKTI